MSGPNKDSVEGTVPHVERRLAAILSADVKGYSRLMGNNDVATVETLTAYREVLTQLVGEQRGRVVDAPGDEPLAESPASWMPSGLPGDRWQVYDLDVDGVSLVANYRAQFNKITRTSSYDALVTTLRSRQAEFLAPAAAGSGAKPMR